jgi:hypothetical protein
MTTLTAEALDDILRRHRLWLKGDAGGARANLRNANLRNADLSNADLYNADLYNANLSNADLSNANLSNANLSNANLRNANLSNANLYNANLRNASLSWTSHELLSEILFRAAADDSEKRKIAGLIRLSIDWCWSRFLAIDDPLRDWALDELRKWVKPGDDAPEVLQSAEATT